jgi:hypothetical protein
MPIAVLMEALLERQIADKCLSTVTISYGKRVAKFRYYLLAFRTAATTAPFSNL